MTNTIANSDGPAVIEVDARTNTCVIAGCGGAVVRHSLGSGMAVDRCTRCFRRYTLKPAVSTPSRLRKFMDDFVTWRD